MTRQPVRVRALAESGWLRANELALLVELELRPAGRARHLARGRYRRLDVGAAVRAGRARCRWTCPRSFEPRRSEGASQRRGRIAYEDVRRDVSRRRVGQARGTVRRGVRGNTGAT